MTCVFWLSLLSLIYVYAGYPLLVWILGRLRSSGLQPAADSGRESPTVTVLIAAHDEAAHIENTVRNKLSQGYPTEKLEVIVVSDESRDGTDAIVQGIDDVRVRLVRQEPRAGKTSGLNLIVPLARGDILVFSDANSHYAPDTVAELVQTFADPAVGYVTGRMLYRAPDGSASGEGCSTYMRYENRLRNWETRLGSIVGRLAPGGYQPVTFPYTVPGFRWGEEVRVFLVPNTDLARRTLELHPVWGETIEGYGAFWP